MRALFLLLLLFMFAPHAAQAQNANSDAPLEITADNTLEWHRNEKQYIARGNVIAKQGDVTIAADTLTADYQETPSSSFEIYRLTAAGNVKISSRGSVATGAQATYDVTSGLAVMTGNNLTLTSPDQTVTARDSFEYNVTQGRLTARGNAQAIRGKDKINADTMAAIFTEDANGKRTLQRMEANGHVKITTPTEILTGERGEYDAATNIAAITGNVKITRGPNVLEGERAEVNLTTNVSTMKGGPSSAGGQSGGRVRGVFYPDSTKKAPIDAPPPQPSSIMTAPVTPTLEPTAPDDASMTPLP